ncbi:hypothetical protein U1Q18_038898 [Sarracenia purpurea var. burkii]
MTSSGIPGLLNDRSHPIPSGVDYSVTPCWNLAPHTLKAASPFQLDSKFSCVTDKIISDQGLASEMLAHSHLPAGHSWRPQLHLSAQRILGIFGVDWVFDNVSRKGCRQKHFFGARGDWCRADGASGVDMPELSPKALALDAGKRQRLNLLLDVK